MADFAGFIKNLPQAALAFDGVEAFLLDGPQGQAVFFEIPKGITVPLHSHCGQWGIVVEGAIEMNIGGKVKVYRSGESYEIGDGEAHGATTLEACKIIDVFSEAGRYKAK